MARCRTLQCKVNFNLELGIGNATLWGGGGGGGGGGGVECLKGNSCNTTYTPNSHTR